MKSIVFIVLLSIFGCQVPTSTQYSNYIEAVWDGNTIYAITSAGNLYFDAPKSSAGIPTSVFIIQIGDRWFIYDRIPHDEIYLRK